MTEGEFRTIVERARLAPSVHNTQPARWRLHGDTIEILLDSSVALAVGDPDHRDALLSVGAAIEATFLALLEHGWTAEAVRANPAATDGLRSVATLSLTRGGEPDALAAQLDRRFTHRGPCDAGPHPLVGWTRSDAVLVTDRTRIADLARLNDAVSLRIMAHRPFRRELLHWMRLSPRHPRYALDGMSRAALRMSPGIAFGARLTLGPLWGLCHALGLTRGMTAEADATNSAAVVACFHRPREEDPVMSGRAYLRMWLEATSLGMAGWPMAALADDADSNAEVCRLVGIGADRRLVQVIRFGPTTAPMPPRARRPLRELIVA